MSKRWFLVSTSLAIGTAIAYVAYWVTMANSIERSFHGEVGRWRSAGVSVDFAALNVGGFPTHFRSTLSLPRADHAVDRWQYSGDAISAETPAWRPRELRYRLLGQHRLQAVNGDETLNFAAEGGGGRIGFDGAGRMRDGELELAGVSLELPDIAGVVTAERLIGLMARPTSTGAETVAGETLTVRLGLGGVTIPAAEGSPLGSHIDFLDLDTRLHGAAWGGRSRETLTAWRDRDGRLEIRELALDWGRVEARGDGQFTVDHALRPVGELSLRVVGADTIIDMLIDNGRLELGAGTMAKLGLLILAKTQPDGAVPVPLSDRDGQLFLSGFNVAEVTPLVTD